MDHAPPLPQSAAFNNLRRLFWRRNVMAAMLTVAGLAAMSLYDKPLPMMPMEMSGAGMHTMHMRHDNGFSILLLGVWAGFVVSAGVIALLSSAWAAPCKENWPKARPEPRTEV